IQLKSPKLIDRQQIKRSVEIKNQVVLEDPYEKGLRKILNYGHTIGHAVESWSLENDSSPLTHGEAIALGMICEAHLANQLNQLSDEDLTRIKNDILRFFP